LKELQEENERGFDWRQQYSLATSTMRYFEEKIKDCEVSLRRPENYIQKPKDDKPQPKASPKKTPKPQPKPQPKPKPKPQPQTQRKPIIGLV
jgi:hypothetical protein